MTAPASDQRSPDRRARDEQIAAMPPLPPMELSPSAVGSAVEEHLAKRRRHPLAVVGVVENGLVRPLDVSVKLAENSRVIIVAAQE